MDMRNPSNSIILIVDDDQDMAISIQDILRTFGHKTETAYSARDALDLVEKKVFGCVLSDIHMPEKNGVELFREIKAVQPELPIVLMTAHRDQELLAGLLGRESVVVLRKPINFEQLLGVFSALVED
jgi:DNA-binding NtrC family response regulator